MKFLQSVTFTWVLFWINIALAVYSLLTGNSVGVILNIIVAVYMLLLVYLKEWTAKKKSKK